MARRRYESRAVWAERVAAWRASGLSGGRFAEQHGLLQSSLYRWGKLLGDGASETLTPRPRFAQVVLKAPGPEAAVIEVVLSGGRIVRVRGAVDSASLQAVVAALESC
jgi:hypothetical protein